MGIVQMVSMQAIPVEIHTTLWKIFNLMTQFPAQFITKIHHQNTIIINFHKVLDLEMFVMHNVLYQTGLLTRPLCWVSQSVDNKMFFQGEEGSVTEKPNGYLLGQIKVVTVVERLLINSDKEDAHFKWIALQQAMFCFISVTEVAEPEQEN